MLKKTNLVKAAVLILAVSAIFILPEIASGGDIEEKDPIADAAQYTMPADDILAETGMPQEEIDALDPDFKDYIAQRIDLNAEDPPEYVPVSGAPEVQNPKPFTIDGKVVTADDILAETGMPQEEIDALDPDFKDYIAQYVDLDAEDPPEYIKTDPVGTTVPYPGQSLEGIEFSVKAIRYGSRVEVFPMYEFTTPKRPRGQDSFSFRVGNALDPYGFTGRVWYKDGYGSWKKSVMLNMPIAAFDDGAEFAGDKLGNSSIDVYIKGCGIFCADITSGTSKEICISYMYNPNKGNYTINFTKGSGLSYTSDKQIYYASQILQLYY